MYGREISKETCKHELKIKLMIHFQPGMVFLKNFVNFHVIETNKSNAVVLGEKN